MNLYLCTTWVRQVLIGSGGHSDSKSRGNVLRIGLASNVHANCCKPGGGGNSQSTWSLLARIVGFKDNSGPRAVASNQIMCLVWCTKYIEAEGKKLSRPPGLERSRLLEAF